MFKAFHLAPLMGLMALLPTSVPADDELPNSRADALSMEAKDALPLTQFYDPPQPLERAAAGTLIRSEPFFGYSVPKGARAVRILYHSRALNGADIAASGVVLIPAGTAPPGALLVLAGDDDKSVAIANIEAGVKEACSRGLPIEYIHRPSLDHDPLMQETTPEQLDWVRERLSRKPWVGNCGPNGKVAGSK